MERSYMPNKPFAMEWLQFGYKNLLTAQFLYDAEHFEDIIGIELQQVLEKALKAIFANENRKIPREHDLVKLYFLVEEKLLLSDEEIVLLRIATNYYKDERYPNPNYTLPPREEIKEVMEFAYKIFDTVCQKLKIDKREIDVR